MNQRAANVVSPMGLQGDAYLVAEALDGSEGAWSVLYERHLGHVVRVLARILGSDADLPDLANDVFVTAFRSLGKLSQGAKLRPYLTGLCVNVAKNRIRSKRRHRWLVFGPVEVEREPSVADGGPAREALRATYQVLARLDADLRTCFSLRYIEGLELTEVAEACSTSLATAKRWLKRAETEFLRHAHAHPALEQWVRESDRWGGGT